MCVLCQAQLFSPFIWVTGLSWSRAHAVSSCDAPGSSSGTVIIHLWGRTWDLQNYRNDDLKVWTYYCGLMHVRSLICCWRLMVDIFFEDKFVFKSWRATKMIEHIHANLMFSFIFVLCHIAYYFFPNDLTAYCAHAHPLIASYPFLWPVFELRGSDGSRSLELMAVFLPCRSDACLVLSRNQFNVSNQRETSHN